MHRESIKYNDKNGRILRPIRLHKNYKLNKNIYRSSKHENKKKSTIIKRASGYRRRGGRIKGGKIGGEKVVGKKARVWKRKQR